MQDIPITPWYPLKIFLGIIGYLGYFLSAVMFFLVGIPFLMILAPWPRLMQRIMYSVLKAYAFVLVRIWLPGLGVYSFTEQPGGRARAVRGSVVVANHRSRLDALIMLSMLPQSGVVIKSNYAGVPLFSTFVKHLDFVSIDPDSLSSLAAAMEKCRAILASGKNLLVFPEGTRAKTGKLLPFGTFPFKIAVDSGAPVVPAVIHSDLPLMARRKGSIFPPYRFRYVIRLLEACRSKAAETAPDFARRVRDLMSEQLEELDKGTCWETSSRDGDER